MPLPPSSQPLSLPSPPLPSPPLTQRDIAAPEELAIDVDLREGGPRAVLLEALPEPLVLEDVHRLVGHLERVEDHDARVGEAALWEHLGALHEQHHLVLRDELVQGFLQLGGEGWG